MFPDRRCGLLRRKSRTHGVEVVVELLLLLFSCTSAAKDTRTSKKQSGITRANTGQCRALQGVAFIRVAKTALLPCCRQFSESWINYFPPAGSRSKFLEVFRSVFRRDRSVRLEGSPARNCSIQRRRGVWSFWRVFRQKQPQAAALAHGS